MGVSVHASYDYETDEFWVSSFLYYKGEVSSDNCEAVITDQRGKVALMFVQWFSHTNYEKPTAPDDLENQLRKRINLQCILMEVDSFDVTIKVKGALNSDKFFISK